MANDVLINNQKELPAEGASAYQHAETSIEEVIKMSENKNKPELDMNEIEKATGGFGSRMETCDHVWEDTGIVDEVPYFVFATRRSRKFICSRCWEVLWRPIDD